MKMNIKLKQIKQDEEMSEFWCLFDVYIHELAENANQGDGIDLEYFCSDEYRNAINAIRKRERKPIRINFVLKDDEIIGFAMCQLLFDEDNNCTLMEFYLKESYRNKGLGKIVYNEIEKTIVEEGLVSIDLTPTNEVNKRFWESVGYNMTSEIDEDNKHIYKKHM